MSRNLKVLGLALVAVLAFSAVAAAGASATTHTFEAEEPPITLTGIEENGDHVFKAQGEGVVCTESSFHGVAEAASQETARVAPSYGGVCETESGIGAEVKTNGCEYVFGGETTEDEHAHLELDCGHSTKIEIIVGGGLCTIEIGDTHDEVVVNDTLDGVHYTNITDPDTEKEAVTVDATVTDIKYTVVGAFCAFAGISTGTHSDGTYDGDTIVTGEELGGGDPRHVTFSTTP